MSTSIDNLIDRFPYLADEYQLQKMGMSIEEVRAAVAVFDAVCGVEGIRSGDLFRDCDGDLNVMSGPGLFEVVTLNEGLFFKDGSYAGESVRTDYKFGIVYSCLFKGEWWTRLWTPDAIEAQLAVEWKRV